MNFTNGTGWEWCLLGFFPHENTIIKLLVQFKIRDVKGFSTQMVWAGGTFPSSVSLPDVFCPIFMICLKNYTCTHFRSHCVKIVRTARLLTNDDQNTLPLDQSGYTDILVPKEPSNPHAIVSASTLSFLSTLRANEIIQLACSNI